MSDKILVWEQRRDGQHINRSGDHRSAYQRDRARILHSAAFRRLQAKTQVVGVGVGDFYRTRLTHSLEASQIGNGITAQLANKHQQLSMELSMDSDLIESLCLAHDIGHPPFGHGGEVALHYMMRNSGGFEGNAQTFRILALLEKYTEAHGMNLARRTLLGFIKYPNSLDNLTAKESPPANTYRTVKAGHWHPPKGLYQCDMDIFDWVTEPLSNKDKQLFMSYKASSGHHKTCYKSFDCSIMELADDIAYSIHDLEDAIVMGMVSKRLFEEEVSSVLRQQDNPWLREKMKDITENLFSDVHYHRKNAIGALVNIFITDIAITEVSSEFDEPLLKYNAEFSNSMSSALTVLKRFVYEHVIRNTEIQRFEYKGQQMVMELFDALASDPERFLPKNTVSRWRTACGESSQLRVLADYVSGMTDEYASKMYSDLFLPKHFR